MRRTKTRSQSFTFREPYSYRNDPGVPEFPDDRPVIIFDGFCSLCSGWAACVLRHDKRDRFRLLAAQSELGRSLYIHYGLDPQDYETNILIEQGVAWFKSEGSIRMAIALGWPWRAAVALRMLPTPFSDWLYDKVARNRLRLFGKKHTCYTPAPEDADRFLS
jgi:predicted DCC family thiol-disulfide oxidoreductase YuxK